MVLAKVCVNNWAGRRELDCEVVKETKTRYVCHLLSDGLQLKTDWDPWSWNRHALSESLLAADDGSI